MTETDRREIGGFRIEAELKASGAQGRVYKAVCETDSLAWCAKGTVVALKAMQVNADADGEGAGERLRRRTEALVALRHPNVVRYLGCFVEPSAFSETHVVVQEFLVGETLKARLAAQPTGLDADFALKVALGVASGLAAAAKAGIVHRDVKPENVFLCSDGSVKLIDFEVARQSGNTTSASGGMVGSFDYMAPDFSDPHFAGDEISDVFSAGAVIHEALTGKLPYRRFGGQGQQAGFAFLDRWSRDADGKFIRGECAVSSSVERILAHARPVLQKALAVRREARFPTFDALREALEGVRFRDLRNGGTSYRILQLVGKGGFGEVFKARSGGHTFAVKHLLKPDYAARFFREAKIMSELNDPCFVRFFDFFVLEHAGVKEAFLVMDFLPGMPGSSLRDAIRRSAGCGLDRTSVLKAFVRYAHGLKTIHARGIYHRDVKPTNLYYPEDRPESAAIMDLGIARDASGTETTGQVPGTLDYMPPETALGGTRGDAGMDVYALGLCLYEALSGKKGFPRLPSGSAGYAQFFQRAKDKARPTFDAPCVTAKPALLALLRKMTEPEVSERLTDAGELEEELRRVLADGGETTAADEGETAAPSDSAASASGPAASASADAETADGDDDGETCETAFVPQQGLPQEAVKVIDDGLRRLGGRSREPRSRKVWAFALLGAAAAVAAGAALFWRSEIDVALARLMPKLSRPAGVYSDAAVVIDGESVGAPDVYGDALSSIEEADALRDRWLEDRKDALTEDERVRALAFFERKREQRVIRDRLDTERTQFDADVKRLVETYGTQGVAAGDAVRKAWQKTWGGASRAKVDGAVRLFDKARRARQAVDASKALVPRATIAAGAVAKSYADNGLKIADREAGIWEREWGARLTADDAAALRARLKAARDAVVRQDEEEKACEARRALVAECRALVEMTVPVPSREARLLEAENKARQAAASGILDAKACAAFLKEVEAARAWTVFEVVNRSDLDLKVGGVPVKNASSHVFVYTNAPPETLAVECFGYESFPLGRQTNGKVVTLLPEHFALLKVDVAVGDLDEGVTCRVDGVSVGGKTVRIVPGSHECVYSRKDYRDQVIPFRVEPGVARALPPPGAWARSEEWLQRERDRVRAERAAALEKACGRLLADEPISNRVVRLARCGRILRDWTTPDLLGETRHKALAARLAAAEALSFGAVVNGTDCALTATVAGETLSFAPAARTLVSYPSSGSLDATLVAAGYEPIPFPEKFAGAELRVVPAMLKPAPVEIAVHGMPADVSCVLDGKAVAGASFKALPGAHALVFRRPDHEAQQVTLTVKLGEPVGVACPTRWTPTKGLSSLVAAEAAAEAGDWNRAKNLLGEADVRGEEALNRKMALSLRFEQRKRFLKRLDEAALAYHEERWHDVVKLHFDLKLNGYVMTREDRKRVAEAIRQREGHLEMLRKIAGTGDFGASTEKIDAEIRSFRAMSGLLEQELTSSRNDGKENSK